MTIRSLITRLAPAFALLALAACGPPKTADTSTVARSESATPAAAPVLTDGAKPALWRTGDADTTIYFLGTVHVLPPDLNWRTAAIDKALADSKAVYFETELDPDQGRMNAFYARLGFYPPGQTLSDHLSVDQRRAVASAASKLSEQMTRLDMMRPWLAMLALNRLITLKAGYEPESGVERTLSPLIADQHKQVRTLETVEEQLLAFADLPEKVQVDYLVQGLKDLDKNKDLLDALVKAWSEGDVEQLEKLLIEDDVGEDPAVEQALLVNRNKKWSEKLDALVKDEPGVFLVAVGAAHLTGKDSVRALLEAKGYKVERVE